MRDINGPRTPAPWRNPAEKPGHCFASVAAPNAMTGSIAEHANIRRRECIVLDAPGGYARSWLLCLQNYARNCIILRVAESDERGSDSPSCGKSISRSRKNQKWFAAFFSTNVDVAPAHCLAYPGAERFGSRLLTGESRSQMTLRKFHRHRIFNFTICENAPQKAVSELLYGMLDAPALDNIHADTNYAHLEL
jgi:hypothetical protein